MAITAVEFSLLTQLHGEGVLPRGGDLVELGPQTWYGDVPVRALAGFAAEALAGDADGLAAVESRLDGLFSEAQAGLQTRDGARTAAAYDRIARTFYDLLFAPASYLGIDLEPGPDVLVHDLNQPVPLERTFDVVTNIGTAEHVFDVAQVFRSVHALVRPGGVMVHTAPFTGWWDHGFYGLQPTLFFDVAEANGYELLGAACGSLKPFSAVRLGSRDDLVRLGDADRIARHSVFHAVFRKTLDRPFTAPVQGIYAGTLSPEAAAAWRRFR